MMPLSELLSHLEADSTFASEALHELEEINSHLKVKSTYSIASAASGLVDQWLVERDLKCYERNREVEDVTEAVVSKDDIDLGIAMIEDSWKIDTGAFCLLLKGKGMTIPGFLNAESQLKRDASARAEVQAPSDRIKPVSRLAAQDAAILEEIRRQGHDPLALPKPPAGKSGVKAVIRKLCLSSKDVFQSKGVFDEAWQRLRDENKIVDLTGN